MSDGDEIRPGIFAEIGVQNADGYTDAHGVECYVKRMFQA